MRHLNHAYSNLNFISSIDQGIQHTHIFPHILKGLQISEDYFFFQKL